MQKKVMILIMVLLVVMGFGQPATAQAPTSAFEQLLKNIPDNQISRTVIWYGSLAELQKALNVQVNSFQAIAKLPQDKQATFVLDASTQIYISQFNGLSNPTDWVNAFGLDPYKIDRELTVGTDPNWYGMLFGSFTSSQIVPALQKLGYKTAQVGNNTVYSIGADNAPNPNSPADDNYNRLIVKDGQLIAAASTATIQAATAAGNTLATDPAISAITRTLDAPTTVPNTVLTSAVVYDGNYLLDKVLAGADPGKNQAILQLPLARYKAAGIGYRRSAQSRSLVITLAYTDAGAAAQAKTTLNDRLAKYVSVSQPIGKEFLNWPIITGIAQVNNLQIVTAVIQYPPASNFVWLQMVQNKDILFLAAQ